MTRIDRPAPDIPDNQRCRWETRVTGQVTRCGDVGNWVLDEKNKTWRPANSSDTRRRCWLHGPATSKRPVGRNRKTDQPNERLQRYAALVLGLAAETTIALREVNEELSLLGFPSTSGGGGGSSDDDGPVARDAIRITELTALREDLRDRLRDDYIADWLTDLSSVVTRIRRRPGAARDAKLCQDNQQAREGSIEWGDPTCTELPIRDGLCSGCWQRERRWRTQNGMKINVQPAREHPDEDCRAL